MTEQQTSSELVIDWAAALEGVGGDESLLVDLINIFFDEATASLAGIQRAMQDHDYANLNLLAHRLKGAAKIFGPTPAMLVAQELEALFKELGADQKAVKQGKKDPAVLSPSRVEAAYATAPRLLAELETQVHRLNAALRTRLGQ